MSAFPWLSLAIWVPIVCGVLLWIQSARVAPNIARRLALAAAVVSFGVTLTLIAGFDTDKSALQFSERLSWIKDFNVHYHLGVDGISLGFVELTALMTVAVGIAVREDMIDRIAHYLAAFLILSGLMMGVFSAQDGLLFYIFFEATLIPMVLIIGIWGGQKRVYAAFKFFLYTLLGSLLMLLALLYLYTQSGSFALADWQRLPLPMPPQLLLFGAFFMAFAVKVP